MFVLHVRLIMGRYYACDYRNRAKAEWPPHPARLFSAMVAAAGHLGNDQTFLNALRWLEQQPAPEIAASDCSRREGFTHFVPVNDKVGILGQADSRSIKQPRQFPSVSPESETVSFVWSDATPSRDHLAVLDKLCRHVQSLGHSASLVRLKIGSKRVETNHTPNEGGSMAFRVPYEGRLAELERLFTNGERPNPGRTTRYTNAPVHDETVIDSSFGDMIIWRCAEGRVPLLRSAINLCSRFREAVLAHAGDAAPEELHGHGGEHVAYVALPFVGSKYADGRILGIAAVLPRGLKGAKRREVLAHLAKLKELNLGKLGVLTLERIVLPSAAKTLDRATWVKPSNVFASVTPVVLPVYPKDKDGKRIGDILVSTCRVAGLPEPEKITVAQVSRFLGAPNAQDCLSKRKTDERTRACVHVTLRFSHAVRGPILLGVNRHFGLGLLKPFEGERE